MGLPVIRGLIRRRILVNFRVDPRVMQIQLPSRFRPKLHRGHAIAGICLIRLEAVRPRLVPQLFGFSSENAAHRIAVRWQAEGAEKEGVFIPRRDTGSAMTQIAGGRLFPGEHHRASFSVREGSGSIDLSMQSNDREVSMRVRGRLGGPLPSSSCFSSLAEASGFFEPGSLGYSVTSEAGRLDGIELRTHGWRVEPLQVEEVFSSYFSDPVRFPKGSVEFDCALVMRNVGHEWHGAEDLYV
jgi:Uncharacterized conserved protein (COG2071)